MIDDPLSNDLKQGLMKLLWNNFLALDESDKMMKMIG